MVTKGLVATRSHHTHCYQRDRQNEREHADKNPYVDQTDAHPNWIGGRASPLPTPNTWDFAGWGIRALESVMQASEIERPERPNHAGADRNLELSQGGASALQCRHLALNRKTTSPISTRSPSRSTTDP